MVSLLLCLFTVELCSRSPSLAPLLQLVCLTELPSSSLTLAYIPTPQPDASRRLIQGLCSHLQSPSRSPTQVIPVIRSLLAHLNHKRLLVDLILFRACLHLHASFSLKTSLSLLHKLLDLCNRNMTIPPASHRRHLVCKCLALHKSLTHQPSHLTVSASSVLAFHFTTNSLPAIHCTAFDSRFYKPHAVQLIAIRSFLRGSAVVSSFDSGCETFSVTSFSAYFHSLRWTTKVFLSILTVLFAILSCSKTVVKLFSLSLVLILRFLLSSNKCEVGGVVQGDEGPVCGVAQVVDCHGVTVGHQEREEEEEQQEEVEGDGEELKERCTWMACGWSE